MKGTLVIIHGNVLHKSEANRSLNSRYIYTFHVIEGEAMYDEKNWYHQSSIQC
jgi:phytanoyl-CoA hydroxylase